MSKAKSVATKGGYVMMDFQHSFGDDWMIQAKVKGASYDHWFNLFLDGDGVRNVPELQGDYLTDRGFSPTAGSTQFTYADNGAALASTDLLFENRVLDRRRPLQELAGEFNLSKEVQIGNTSHNFTLGTYLSNTRAEDDNWIWNYLGDFRNAPRMVNLSFIESTTGDTIAYSTGGFINGSGRQTSNRYHQSSKSAIYFADEIKGERFGIDIGFRWERAVGIISRETGIASNTFQKGEVSANDFAVIVAGMFKINEQVNIYANASSGYFFPELRSVSFSAPGRPQSYETERINQAEIGTKIGTRKFAATVAAFFANLQDRRSIDFVNDGQGGVIEEVFTQSTRTLG
ncbi:MAG: TonB-dependent receptor, partial [Bacteroidota bacterium]